VGGECLLYQAPGQWYGYGDNKAAGIMLQQRTHVDRITEDSQIMAGKPVVTSTSIPVEQVLAQLAEKPDLNGLFGVFPR
jgi:hypothetical protein